METENPFAQELSEGKYGLFVRSFDSNNYAIFKLLDGKACIVDSKKSILLESDDEIIYCEKINNKFSLFVVSYSVEKGKKYEKLFDSQFNEIFRCEHFILPVAETKKESVIVVVILYESSISLTYSIIEIQEKVGYIQSKYLFKGINSYEQVQNLWEDILSKS
jgi:hypothetical protein